MSSQSRDARRIVRNFTLHSVRAIDITTVRQCVGEDQLLDLTLSTTKINHSLHSTAVQMIKNVHFCAKIFTSKVQFRLLLHTQVTKNLKNEIKMTDLCQGRWTWIGPAVIVNSILFASYSWYSWSCDHG